METASVGGILMEIRIRHFQNTNLGPCLYSNLLDYSVSQNVLPCNQAKGGVFYPLAHSSTRKIWQNTLSTT